MRTIRPSKTGLNKLRSHHLELRSSDMEDHLRSFTPGEWCLIEAESERWLCFVNPLVNEKFSSVYVVEKITKDNSQITTEDLIRDRISRAYNKRLRFQGYDKGSRIFYGVSDGLPGLIIDLYMNAAVVQINTAGIDRYRELIKAHVETITGRSAYLLDNEKYREREGLPSYGEQQLPSLSVVENGISYEIRSSVLQKVGFYYDHRENRLIMQSVLKRFSQPLSKGVDLFCYVGAWGLNALSAGVEHVDFVDQGDFGDEIKQTLEMNSFAGRGEFFRGDVFRFMDERIQKKQGYDLIMSDPPAFAKSANQKAQALEGYSKLHRKVLKLANPGAICIFSSCTHYVSWEEFQKNIIDAAQRENKKIQLLSTGIQGWDHPVRALSERSNYIKSFTYILES